MSKLINNIILSIIYNIIVIILILILILQDGNYRSYYNLLAYTFKINLKLDAMIIFLNCFALHFKVKEEG